MKFTSVLSGVLVATSSLVSAAPLESRQANTIAITGVQNNGVQNRRELRDMQRNDPDQFNLYLLALRRMMSVNQNDPRSFYQIAGIHGRPYQAYNGYNSPPGANANSGYCTHASNIFLPWHRPYLALYEQVLYGHVQAVAASFPPDRRQRYQNAAVNFRIPYWDWAAPAPCSVCEVWPKLVSTMYMSMDTPDGGQRNMLNPLFRYDFQGAPSSLAFDPFATWTVTKRAPTSWDAAGVSQNDRVATSMNNINANLASRVYNVLTGLNTFSAMSNAVLTSSGNADSLESLHDTIHATTGQNGHMSYLDYSAFDPIFFLHHVNVDRIWAIWSALNPNSYVEARSGETTYYITSTQTVDAGTGLAPFSRDTSGNLWTPNDVRSTSRFNYNYPELANGATRASISNAINRLYGSGRGSAGRRSLVKRDADEHNYQYMANIASQRFGLGGTYSIYIFLDEPSANPNDWAISDKLVGTHGVFANPKGDNDRMGMNLMVTGTIPLNAALQKKIDAGELKSMATADVEPYLQKNLQWKCALFNGQTVEANDVPDLSVSVVISDVTPPASQDKLPQWNHYASLSNITTGKAGGFIASTWDYESSWSLGELINTGVKGTKVSAMFKWW